MQTMGPADSVLTSGSAEHVGSASGTESHESPNDPKRLRACDGCRGLKVKCEQLRPDLPCLRCQKANRPCHTTPPARRRQKKSDSRVAELERKVEYLTSVLMTERSGATPSRQEPEPKKRRTGEESSSALRCPSSPAVHHIVAGTHALLVANPDLDQNHHEELEYDHSEIGRHIRDLIGQDTEEHIFRRYVDDICPRFPAVLLPPGMTAEEMRRKKPLLLLAILSGCSTGSALPILGQHAQQRLGDLFKHYLGQLMIFNSEKSLELIQALQVAVLWYRPPVRSEEHNFCLMVNSAVALANEMHLTRPAAPEWNPRPSQKPHLEPSSLEARRAYLVCYYLTMSITVVLRYTPLLRWTGYTQECVEMLQRDKNVLPSDKLLCQYIQLARITERIVREFSLDNPNESSLLDAAMASSVCSLDTQLKLVFDGFGPDKELPPALRLAMRLTSLVLYEIVVQGELNASQADPGRAANSHPEIVQVLKESLRAIKAALDTALEIGVEELMILPVIFCVRVTSAIVSLQKFWALVARSRTIGALFRHEDVQLDEYIKKMLAMFKQVVLRDRSSPHSKFYFIVKLLQQRMNPNEGRTTAMATATNQNRLHVLSEAAQQQQQQSPAGFVGQPQQQHHTPHYNPVVAGPSQQLLPQHMQSYVQLDDQLFRDAVGMGVEFDPRLSFFQPDMGVFSDPGIPNLDMLAHQWAFNEPRLENGGNMYQ
ncbi:uncharacterized protein EI97DRAFT_127762 [Westerdykella ornata]|uniref:Zn(2)-C6 fungal-type domain-containing protein n=1 Tax=Westerdykella ornata TaxID=318751 RepID=A0A6A6JDZ4_WESOR|nr:uncharacterized protein EI97DRAFT_127762 [Westerdykella ornata]KAF2274393.1 hypothetical protein EI97DRAFT_127762 [Westerdykella ornata]